MKKTNLFATLSLVFAAHLLALAVIFCLVAPVALHAQAEAAPAAVAPAATDWLTGLLTGLVGSHPWATGVLLVMGALRACFKPVMAAIESYVKSTPSTTDDEFIAQAQHSPAYKVFAWCLDFFGSVKIGPQFTAKSETPPDLAR